MSLGESLGWYCQRATNCRWQWSAEVEDSVEPVHWPAEVVQRVVVAGSEDFAAFDWNIVDFER